MPTHPSAVVCSTVARITLAVAAIVATGCQSHRGPAEPEPPSPEAEEAAHEELPRIVKLRPEVVRDARVTTVQVERRRLAATVDLNGQLVADPDHFALVGARVAGRVVKVLVREGDAVRAGQTLAVITSPELARRRAEYAASSAKAASVRRNAERLRVLHTKGLTAEQEAVTAEAEASALEAERDAAAAAIRGTGAPLELKDDPSLLVLTSPIAGQVVRRDGVAGQAVDPSHDVVAIADLTRLWFQAQLFEKDLGKVVEGAAAEVRLNGLADRVLTGHVARIAAEVDPGARTLTARIVLERPAGLPLGLFGTARVSRAVDEGEEYLVVPLDCVTSLAEHSVVFVEHPGNAYEVHHVKLGPTAGGLVAILSGLSPGEAVVTSGVHTLKSIVLKATMAEDE